jgi:hypothetical protein
LPAGSAGEPAQAAMLPAAASINRAEGNVRERAPALEKLFIDSGLHVSKLSLAD